MSQKRRDVSRNPRRWGRRASVLGATVVMLLSSVSTHPDLSDYSDGYPPDGVRGLDEKSPLKLFAEVFDQWGMEMTPSFTAGQYVGDDLWVSVLDGGPRQYVDLDTAATSSASVVVNRAVQEFLPWYASVHRGAGIRSQLTSARYEEARDIIVRFVGGDTKTHTALFPRNTTEAINMLAFRLGMNK
jgi:aminotransferase class V